MPSNPALVKFRAQSSLFGLLDEAGQLQLMAAAKVENHPAGAILVKQGDEGHAFFILSEGKLEVQVEEEGQARPIATLERGAFFGEIAALLGETRSATVKALGPVTVMRFDMPAVKEILAHYPAVRQVLVRLALKRGEENLTEQMQHDFA